jgi:hypothetical protein
MNSSSNKAVVNIALIGILLLVTAIGYEADRLFSSGRNKATADKLAAASQTVQQQATQINTLSQQAKVSVAQAVQDHQAENKAHEDREANATGFVEGSVQALQSEPNPTQAEIVALALTQQAEAALGGATAAEKAVWTPLVVQLLKNNTEAWAKVQQLQSAALATNATLRATSQRAEASDSHVTQLVSSLSVETKAHVDSAAQATTLAVQNKTWADNALSWYQRFKALGYLSTLLVALVAFIGVKLFGAKAVLTDAVALGEYLKNGLVAGGKDVVSLEKEIHDWFEGDVKSEATITAIKKNVLRQ